MGLDVLLFTGAALPDRRSAQPVQLPVPDPDRARGDHDARRRGRGRWCCCRSPARRSCSRRHRPLPLGGSRAPHGLHLQRHVGRVRRRRVVHRLLLAARAARAGAPRSASWTPRARPAPRQERLASLATLAAGAAHELLTPLSTIAVVAKRSGARSRAAGRAGARASRTCGWCARRSIAAARSSSGCAPTRATRRARGSRPVPVAALVESARRAASPIRASRCARDRAPRSPIGVLTSRRARSVRRCSALIENAQQASPPGDDVVLRVAPAGGHIRFEISDRGAGIAGRRAGARRRAVLHHQAGGEGDGPGRVPGARGGRPAGRRGDDHVDARDAARRSCSRCR